MKSLKKVLSVVLAVAMLACSMAVVASADGNYTTVKSWGLTEFANFAESGLVSDADHAVLSRQKSVGAAGYGVYGYISTGTNATVAGGHTYTYVLSLDWSGVSLGAETTNGLCVDCWVSDAEGSPTISNGISNETLRAAYEQAVENGFKYTADGNRYFDISVDLTLPEATNGYDGEFRIYTRGFTDFRLYSVSIYDATADPFFAQPIAVLDSGESSPSNDMDGIRTGTDEAGNWNPYIENSNYELPRGLRVYRGVFEAAKLALGGTKMNFAAGSYSANYSLSFDGVFCADDAVLATAKVKNAEGAEVATKDITKADLTRSIKDSNGGNTTGGFFDGTIDLAVPFTVEADGEYTAELYTTGLANLTVVEASFSAAIPDEEIKAVEDKIAAIGDVKYDPDKSEDSGELITAARDAYNALAEKYGDVSSMVDNFEVLTSAENVYANLKEEYDTMIENAATVDEAINAIEFPITKDSEDAIVTAEETRDSFIEYFGQEKADLHIKGLATLAKAREDFDKLSDVVYGDVNGDGEVTVADALMVLQHSVGKITLDESVLVNADVDGEEGIAVTDALAILQASVNKITLPIVK